MSNVIALVSTVLSTSTAMDQHDVRSNLESMILDETIEPEALPLSLLKDITENFADDRIIGHGGFATVYKVKQL